MLSIVLGMVLLVAIVILGLGFSRPATYRIERSVLIESAAEPIYEILINLKRSPSWSPWEDKDPDMKRSFGGAENGKGATYEWDGDKNVGHGRQEILEVIPHSKIEVLLEFFRPFKGRNSVQYLLEPTGNSTKVRWVMSGPVNFFVRVLGINLDKMIGREFEKGLSNLKALIESK